MKYLQFTKGECMKSIAASLILSVLLLTSTPVYSQAADIKATDRIEMEIPQTIVVAGATIAMKGLNAEKFGKEFINMAEAFNKDSKRFGEDSARVLKAIFKAENGAGEKAFAENPQFNRSILTATLCVANGLILDEDDIERLLGEFAHRIKAIEDKEAKRLLLIVYATIYAENAANAAFPAENE
jgi:hypothetical protein